MVNGKPFGKREEEATYVHVVGGEEKIREFEAVKEARRILSQRLGKKQIRGE